MSSQMQSVNSTETLSDEGNLVVAEEQKPTVCSIAQKLVMLSSFAKELETQSHLIHFNYEGANFFSIHRFLQNQYEAHQKQFDTLGEYVRTLNYWMPMCSCGLHDALPSFRKVESYKALSITLVLLSLSD